MKPTLIHLSTAWSATFLLFASCGKHYQNQGPKNAGLPSAAVRIAPAENKRQIVTEEIVATVRSKTRATLEAKLSGRIQELPVFLGQAVKKGDLVARLDVAETKARLDQAQASLEQAEHDWSRIAALFQGQAVTRSEYDRALAQQRLAKAAVAEAEAMMRYAEVSAPFDGVVSRKWAEVGDLASPGKPLVDLEDPSSLQIEADLPESMIGKIQPGTTLPVRLDGPGPEFEGKVAEVAPSADPASRTVRIKVALAPAPGLIPGRFARVLVPLNESVSVQIPAAALVRRGQLEMVFVVTNREARMHLVRSGKRVGDAVSVLSGLDGGEAVAVEGASSLRDGQLVEVK